MHTHRTEDGTKVADVVLRISCSIKVRAELTSGELSGARVSIHFRAGRLNQRTKESIKGKHPNNNNSKVEHALAPIGEEGSECSCC